MYLLCMCVCVYMCAHAHTHALVVASSIWQSLNACTRLINGWTETKQVKLVGVSFSCIRVLHRFWRACWSAATEVCMYEDTHVYVSVRVPVLSYLEQSGGHKSRRRYRVRLDMQAVPIARRWKNVNKAGSLALFLPHHLNASSSMPLSILTLHLRVRCWRRRSISTARVTSESRWFA